MSDMDQLYQAISLFRRRQYEPCVEVTTRLLTKNPNDQVNHLYMRNYNGRLLKF
jgi:hypothetical protein